MSKQAKLLANSEAKAMNKRTNINDASAKLGDDPNTVKHLSKKKPVLRSSSQ
jgi:hypothetical protein